MAWKCPQCGVDGLPDELSGHLIENGGCGYLRCPVGVSLVCESSGRKIEVRIGTTLGSAALKGLDGVGLQFVSAEQFRLEKAEREGGWVLTNVSWATNPTFLNGSAMGPEGSLLKDGDQISIKGLHFPLKVGLL